jgi:hypothetical protein
MKKNSLNILRLTALAFGIALVLSGCDLAAKNLAKQTLDLTKKMAEYQEKAADIEGKAVALSARDRRTYQEELARLGFEPPDWLFNDAEALSSGAPEETEESGGGFLSGLFGGRGGGNSGSSSGASDGTEAKPSSLAANKWAAGSAASGGAWYSFNATKGRTYHIFWNDEDNSGGTADVKVAAYYRDGSEIFDVDNSSDNTESFTASASGTVKIKVYPYSRSDTGTFSVAYSTNATRPGGGSAASNGGSSSESGGGIGGFLGGLFGGGSSSSGGTFTLTGIPSQYNGKYAMAVLDDARGATIGVGAQTFTELGDVSFTPIRSGRAILNLYVHSSGQIIPYTGNDTLTVEIGITSHASRSLSESAPEDEGVVKFESVSFRNGSATKAWRDGTVSND